MRAEATAPGRIDFLGGVADYFRFLGPGSADSSGDKSRNQSS